MIRPPSHPALAAGAATLVALCGGSLLVLLCVGRGYGVVALALVQAAVAAAFLAAWLRDASRRRMLGRHAGALAGLSLLSGTLPFMGATLARPDSDTAALAVAHALLPLAVVLAGAVWLGARAGGLPFAGFVAGLGGVVLLQWHGITSALAPAQGGPLAGSSGGADPASTTLALAAATVAALCGVLGMPPPRQRLAGDDAVALVVAAQGGSALMLLLPAAWLWADLEPGAAPWGQLAGLAIAGAALGVALPGRIPARDAPGAMAGGVAD